MAVGKADVFSRSAPRRGGKDCGGGLADSAGLGEEAEVGDGVLVQCQAKL